MGVRLQTESLKSADIQALQQAFTQACGLSDDRGYAYHAGIHGLPLPMYCQHGTTGAHGAPLFLPWHRAYLYLFEKALQGLVPGVALPWWDWTSQAAHKQGVPPAYSPQHMAEMRRMKAGRTSGVLTANVRFRKNERPFNRGPGVQRGESQRPLV